MSIDPNWIRGLLHPPSGESPVCPDRRLLNCALRNVNDSCRFRDIRTECKQWKILIKYRTQLLMTIALVCARRWRVYSFITFVRDCGGLKNKNTKSLQELKNQLLLYWHLALFAFISRPLCNSNQFEIHRPLDLPSERVLHNVGAFSIVQIARENGRKINGWLSRCNVFSFLSVKKWTKWNLFFCCNESCAHSSRTEEKKNYSQKWCIEMLKYELIMNSTRNVHDILRRSSLAKLAYFLRWLEATESF